MGDRAGLATVGDVIDEAAADRLPSPLRISLLSGLQRDESQLLRSRWSAIPVERRQEIIRTAAELAYQDVQLDFAILAAIGLDDLDPGVRVEAIAALWEAEDRATARKLTALLRSDPEEDVRAAAARVLGPFVLRRELGTFHTAEGDDLVQALTAAAGDAGEAAEVRASAIESLAPRSLPEVRQLILDAFYDDDRRLHLSAIRAMGESANEDWLEYLYDEMHASDPEMRAESAGSVGAIGSDEAVPALGNLLDDEDMEVAAAAIEALGEIGGEDAVSLLREFHERAPAGLADRVREALDLAEDAGDDEDESDL